MYIEKRLKSNVKLIARQQPNVHSVTVGIWVKAGSITETNAENGISHFIEHMLFKGTKKRTAKQIAIDVDNIGGQINAFTSKEFTCYYIRMVGSKLEEGVEILTDLFCDAILPQDELEKEKGVVLEEIAMNNDDPQDQAMDLIASTFFNGCSLEKTILGPSENIRAFKRENLDAFMDKYYTADNMTVSVAGNFEENNLTNILNEYLFVEKKNTTFRPNSCAGFEAEKDFDTIYKDIEQVHICMGMPGYNLKSDMRYPTSVLNNVIGGSMSSRLFQTIREEMGMAYAVYSAPLMYSEVGMYSLYAGTMAQNAVQVAQLMVEELVHISELGITEAELLQSKEQLKGNILLSLESTAAKMNAMGKSMLLTGRVYTEEEIINMIEAVTMDDVDQVIHEIIRPDQITATYVGRIDNEEELKAITNG